MKYYIIAGEASGDLHGSNLIKEIKKLDTNSSFRIWGGDLMQKQGAELVKHYKDLAFMGFIEVLMNIRTILKNISFCKKDISQYKPDIVILIDYPGFNLRIAKYAKSKGYKICYYISPQIWAWKQSRVHLIKKVVDKMIVVLPFEKAFYQKFNYTAHFVGHPLLDAIEQNKNAGGANESINTSKPIIALLPGSRKQEIKTMLPVMLKVVDVFKDYCFVVAAAPSIKKEFYQNIIQLKEVKIVYNKTYDLLAKSHAAIVTSGTATLETALFNVPEVVCYKGSKTSYLIAKKLIKVKYISLVNLIMEKEIVKELIQNQYTVENLRTELSTILDINYRKKMLNDYQLLSQKLGSTGASKRAAEIITKS